MFEKDIQADKFSLNKDSESSNEGGGLARIKKILLEIQRRRSILKFNDAVWFKEFSETQKENVLIWSEIVNILRKANPEAEIIVLICPFDSLFRKLYSKQIKQKKKIFYELIGDVQVIDDFDVNDGYVFADHCHLKTESGLRYTQYVRNQLGDVL